MKAVFESVIKKGSYSLPDMLKKIDSYHISGKLTDAQRDDLYAQARGGADPAAEMDLLAKVKDLEERVRKLEQAEAVQPDPGEGSDAYTAGKWYYSGDRITFEGKAFICIAPEGAVCTWSPAEYPAFWEAEV